MRSALGLVLVALAIAGCTAVPPRPAATGRPAAACVPVASTAPTGTAPTGTGPTGTGLPDLSLPCLAGGQVGSAGQVGSGQQVRLARLPRPAIVNLWASWCPPCRAEMPAIQRYAAANPGRVTVLGVDTGDTRAAAGSVVADIGIGYPNLYDPDKRLLAALGYSSLPVTLFIDRTGTIRHRYQGQPLTEQSLTQLATRYLGS